MVLITVMVTIKIIQHKPHCDMPL